MLEISLVFHSLDPLITWLTISKNAELTMDIGPTELIIILIIVVLLFGVGRISKIAGELGSGIRAFREGLQTSEEEEKPQKTAVQAETPATEEPIEAEKETATAKDS
jgi:sec-independent protein translocase protein TatA